MNRYIKRRALREEIQKKYNSGQQDFSGIDLSELLSFGGYFDEIILRGANLKGVNCGQCFLINADLSGANLEGVDFSGAYLLNANLSGANLRKANLNGANLTEANLTGADLSEANFNYTILKDAKWIDTKITQKTFFKDTIMPDGSVVGSLLKSLKESEFLELYAAGERDFQFTVMSPADLSGVDLPSINLGCAKLSYINFSGANLSKSNLRGASLIFCDFKDARISSDLTSTKFIYCDLRRVSGSCHFSDTRFVNVNRQDATWSGGGKEFNEYYNVIRRDGVLIHGPTNTLYPPPYLPPDFSY